MVVNKLPKFNFNKYDQRLMREWTAGTKGLEGFAHTKKIISNMSHNLKTFFNQIHTFFFERTKDGNRKWLNNEKLIKQIDKKLSSIKNSLGVIENQIGSKRMIQNIALTVDEMQTIFKSMKKSGISDEQVDAVQTKLQDVINQLQAFQNPDHLKKVKSEKVKSQQEKISHKKQKVDLEQDSLPFKEPNSKEFKKEKNNLKVAVTKKKNTKDDFNISLGKRTEKEFKLKTRSYEAEDVGRVTPKTTKAEIQNAISNAQQIAKKNTLSTNLESENIKVSNTEVSEFEPEVTDANTVKRAIEFFSEVVANSLMKIILETYLFLREKPSKTFLSLNGLITAYSGDHLKDMHVLNVLEKNLENRLGITLGDLDADQVKNLTFLFNNLDPIELKQGFNAINSLIADRGLPAAIQEELDAVEEIFVMIANLKNSEGDK